MWWHTRRNQISSFRRNGRVHLNRQGRQFSRLLVAEVCASAVVMLDTPCSEVAWGVLATHSIRQFPLHFPSRASPCAITFQLDSICIDRGPTIVAWGVGRKRLEINRPVECACNKTDRSTVTAHITLWLPRLRVTMIFLSCNKNSRLCVGLITHPEESYRVLCVWMWTWILDNEKALAHWGAVAPW